MPESQLRLLLVEDSKTDATLVLRELRQAGFNVEATRVETDADYRVALERYPDIILSDYNLPQFSAMDALRILEESQIDIPLIIVSGSIGEEIAVQAIKRGAKDYLLKDRLGRLGSAIRQVLKEKQLREATLRAEAAMQAAQHRLQHVVASSPAILFTLAVQGDSYSLSWLSGNVKQMMDYTVEEALQPNWWRERVHPEDLQANLAEIKHNLAVSPAFAHEYRFRHRDSQYRWLRSEMKVLRDAAGAPREVVGSWFDITERKQLEEQYRQSQKMEAVGKLAGGVAHDFNNLLTVIMGYCDICQHSLRAQDPLRMQLSEIRKAGERAAGLTRQLLAFSRKQVLAPVVLDLNDILSDLERMLGRLIGEDIALRVLKGKDLWRVKADSGQMEQVMMNVVVNARDAMPLGGKLLLETKNVVIGERYLQTHSQLAPGNYVLLAITDTGVGMDAATQARIFEPFFTTKDPTKGTGLGLATVYGIVKQSGGHVEVYSEIGQGTTFKIYLPRDKGGDAAVAAEHLNGPLRGGTENILLVEDEDAIRTLAKMLLQQHGYQVIATRNGGEALLHCEAHPEPIALLIADVVMPNVSGRQLATRLAPLQPDMKVLYMSGYTDDAIVHHGVLESGMPFLQKPFTPDNLIRKVRQVLDGNAGI